MGTQSYSMEQDTTNTVQEQLDITYPAHSKGDIRFTQFDSKINVPWKGNELITFNDGSSMTMSVGGTYNGVYVSKITPVYDIEPCNPCVCSADEDVYGGSEDREEDDNERKGGLKKAFLGFFSKKDKDKDAAPRQKTQKKRKNKVEKKTSGGLSKEFVDMFSQALSPDVEGN